MILFIILEKFLKIFSLYSHLNEDALQERRAKVLKDFNNIIRELFLLAKNNISYKDEMNRKIVNFFDDKNEFIAVRKFIIKYPKIFLSRYKADFTEEFTNALKQYIQTIEVYNN